MTGHDTLSPWENFYIIVGSSAGALTGLQFVVMALVAETEMATDTGEVDAFGTPTIVHFCAVLFVSAILSMPWPELSQASIVVGLSGALGIGYSLIVVRRAKRTRNYKPEMEDWIFHAVLPLVAYVTLLVSAILMLFNHVPAFFGVAAFALLVLFVGIHNAWDSVTYISVKALERRRSGKPPAASA